MINWQAHPLLRISICFIVGIILQGYIKSSLVILGSFLSIILVITILLLKKRNNTLRQLTTSLILILYIVSGMMRAEIDAIVYQSRLSPLLSVEDIEVTGRVVDIKPTSSGGSKVTLKADLFITYNQQFRISEKIIIFLRKDFQHIQIYDYVSTTGKLHEISSLQNPYGFDYKKHLARKHIYNSLSTYNNKVKVIGPPCKFHGLLNRLRNHIQNHIQNYLLDKNAQALSYGMILGDRADISEDLATTFKSTGSMHTLAVSGLHVGIIAALIGLCFLPFRNKFIISWLKPIIMMASIWVFALVSGSSSSVIRAACMFSFFIWKFHWSENKNPFNLLAVSAFLLLLVEPQAIYQVSFQFSYLAMLGIFLYAPILKKLQNLNPTVLKYTCSLAIVSIAAQSMILPLSLYYFSTAPTYFILGSLISIPATFIIVSLNIIGILAHFTCKPIAVFAGELTDSIVKLVTHTLSSIESLPYASSQSIHLDRWEIILAYIIITSVIYAMYSYRKYFLIAASCLLFSWFCVRKIVIENKKSTPFIMIYDDYKECLIDVFLGNYVIPFSTVSEGHLNSSSKMRKAYGIDDDHIIRKANRWVMGEIEGDYNSIKNNKGSIQILASSWPDSINADILVITKGMLNTPDELNIKQLPDQIILCPGTNKKIIEAWNTYALEHGIGIYNVRDEGSLKLLL